ncbi:hypothetical protein [Tepidibacter sp. Z1-5]|uniref:hypothetical protein n=1 Tax=Tepidibacter sp. Z1-5 TaxID=3134138 RepID=UPI0030BFBE5C
MKEEKMKREFLELTASLLEVERLDGHIEDYSNMIETKINEYNIFFDLNKEMHRFKSKDKDIVLGPVPFASTGNNVKVALMGLNPKFDKGHVADEKISAGTTWDQYSDFYNSQRTFNFVMNEKHSDYYQKTTKLLHALMTGKVEGISSLRRKYNKLANCDYDIFNELTSRNPILLTEFIPFHSAEFATNNNEDYISGLNPLK